MLEMRLNSGTFKMNDDGTTDVSKDVADAIQQGFVAGDLKDDKEVPGLSVIGRKDADNETGRKG